MTLRQRQRRSLLSDYCGQLGALLERRYTERVLVAAKEQAESAAGLAREALRQAQVTDRAKSQFLATVTHELRTPLNAIIGFSEVIQTAPRHSGDIPVYAKYIYDSGTLLLGMLNSLLDLSRIEAGKLNLDEQDVALEEVVNAAVKPQRRAADERSISIVCGPIVERVLSLDLGKITQVFANLLSNAIKFTPEGGTIEIATALTPDGGVSVVVKDTGQGIPSEDLERVLRPFGQLEDHLTRQNTGIGLGLPLARALVRMHGGDLTLASTIGEGTTVEVRLPADRVRPSTSSCAA
jgi:signal transduction histidine kinase